jgi:Carboxypeptidase regulatory-like domain
MRLLRSLPILVLLLFAAPAAAQTVRGTVVNDDARPVAGVLVVLTQPGASQTAAGGLTDAQGRFSLTAPAPGRYTLRAERVGHRPATLDVNLGAGETLEVRLAMAAQAFVLPAVEVNAQARCVVRPGAGLQAYELWQAAAVALRATAVAEERALLEYTVRTYRRELSRGRYRTRDDEPLRVTGTPFHTLEPAELASRGYLREDGDEFILYGPDAQALLSDEFLDGHCLYVETEGGERGQIGLAFEPVAGRATVDIRGTLWLDERTGELRSVDYEYTGMRSDAPGARSGGRIVFARHPSGAWHVRQWYIRTAVRRAGPAAARTNIPTVPGMREAGGEVTDIVVLGEGGAGAQPQP